MSRRRQGITPAAAGIAAAAAGVLSWLALVAWRAAGHEYPQMPWFGLVPLGLYPILVLYSAWRVQQYVRGSAARFPSTSPPTPQQARGTLVAAQAGALGGALLFGWYAANALGHVGAVDVPSVRDLLLRALVSAAGALLVCLSGFLGQWMCRLSEDEDPDAPRRSGDDGAAYG